MHLLAGSGPGSVGTAGSGPHRLRRPAAFVSDVGLLAEEVDPVSGELLGNFPQAFSHIGLVNAAWDISQIELRQTPLVESAPDTSDPSARTPA